MSLNARLDLAGLSGGVPLACGGGSIGDLFSADERASAMALYSVGPLIGPAIGPIMGGFIAQTIGVQYVFIVIAGLCFVAGFIAIPLLRETYAPVLRERRAKKRGDAENAVHKFHPSLDSSSKIHFLLLNLTRPVQLLFGSFICFMLSLYMAL